MLRLPLFCLLVTSSLFPVLASADTVKSDQTIKPGLTDGANYFVGRSYNFFPVASSKLTPRVESRTPTCTASSGPGGKPGSIQYSLAGVSLGTCTVAVNQDGDAEFNAAREVLVNVNIVNPPPAPGVPTALMAIPGDLTANISFLPPAYTGGTGVAITRYDFTCDGGQKMASTFWNGGNTPPTPSTLNFNFGNPFPCPSDQTVNIQIRAQNAGGPGPWSDPVTVTFGVDSDVDTLSDAYEDQFCADGDCNGDGVPDRDQVAVSSVATPDGKSYINLACTDCNNNEQIIRAVPAATPSDFPATSSAPFLGIAFWLQGLNPVGASHSFELTVPANSANPITGLLKKNYRTGNWDNVATSVTTTGGRTKIAYTLTDGDDYDADRKADGFIIDPAFAAAAPTSGASASTGGGALGLWTLIPLFGVATLWPRRRRG